MSILPVCFCTVVVVRCIDIYLFFRSLRFFFGGCVGVQVRHGAWMVSFCWNVEKNKPEDNVGC